MGFLARLFGLENRADPSRTSHQRPAPKQELEIFLKRLTNRERSSLNDAFKKHAGKITSLRELEERFGKAELRLKHARGTFNKQPGWALHQARLAEGHAKEIRLIVEHLRSLEAHEHERDLERDAATIERYAQHLRKQAHSLINALKPIAR